MRSVGQMPLTVIGYLKTQFQRQVVAVGCTGTVLITLAVFLINLKDIMYKRHLKWPSHTISLQKYVTKCTK